MCVGGGGVHLCVIKLRQGALTGNQTNLVSQDSGVLKVLEHVLNFCVIMFGVQELFTNERLQSYVRWSLLRMCCIHLSYCVSSGGSPHT